MLEEAQLLRCRYLYFCTRKASKLSTPVDTIDQLVSCAAVLRHILELAKRQYLYFCTSKASKLSTCQYSAVGTNDDAGVQHILTPPSYLRVDI